MPVGVVKRLIKRGFCEVSLVAIQFFSRVSRLAGRFEASLSLEIPVVNHELVAGRARPFARRPRAAVTAMNCSERM
jgi:hypothetical protein